MALIEHDNSKGLCQEQNCNKKYTHAVWVSIESFKVNILLCEQHDNNLVNEYLQVGSNAS